MEHSLIPADIMDRVDALAKEPVSVENILRLDFALSEAMRYQKMLSKVTSIVLVVIKDNWDQLLQQDMASIQDVWSSLKKMGIEPLQGPDESYSFESYAVARTGYEWTTISNLMRVARAWYLKQLPEGVEIPKDVEIVDPATGKGTGEMVEFNPLEVDWTKLSLCTRPLKDGEMDKQSWGLLANPNTKFRDLHRHTMGLSETGGPQRRIIVQDGLLMVISPSLEEPQIFGSLDLDSNHDDVIWAVNRVLVAIGAKVR